MNDDEIAVNCGRCGRPLILRIDDLRDKHTVDCPACEARAASQFPFITKDEDAKFYWEDGRVEVVHLDRL